VSETTRTTTTIPTPLGVGIVGLGEIGQIHLQGFLRADGARVAAVTDLDAELAASTAAAAGAVAHPDLEALLADAAVDVVSVCLPHRLHKPVALAAIAAGKHVLLEKPLALTVEECDEIIAAAEAAGVKVGVQHNQLYYPAHVRARELLAAGDLGDPVHLRLRLGIGGKLGGWRAEPQQTGGGLLFDAGVHRFYVARDLFGEIVEVSAMVDRGPEEGEDHAIVSLRFASGALGVIDANYRCPPGAFDDAIEIVGTEAMLYVSGCEAEFEGFRTGPALRRYDGTWSDVRVPGGDWIDSVAASIADFVQAVASGAEPPVSARDGRDVVALIRAAYANESVGGMT
jgi:UDP-N-acetylglucosamine 3-dehydrogenase